MVGQNRLLKPLQITSKGKLYFRKLHNICGEFPILLTFASLLLISAVTSAFAQQLSEIPLDLGSRSKSTGQSYLVGGSAVTSLVYGVQQNLQSYSFDLNFPPPGFTGGSGGLSALTIDGLRPIISSQPLSTIIYVANGTQALALVQPLEQLANGCSNLNIPCWAAVAQQINTFLNNQVRAVPVTLAPNESILVFSHLNSSTVDIVRWRVDGTYGLVDSFPMDLTGANLVFNSMELSDDHPIPIYPRGFTRLPSEQSGAGSGMAAMTMGSDCTIFVNEGAGNQATRPVFNWVKQTVLSITQQLAQYGQFNATRMKIYPLSYSDSDRITSSAAQLLPQIVGTTAPGGHISFVGHSQGALMLSYGLRGALSSLYSRNTIDGFISVDPPLRGGWLTGDRWWDAPLGVLNSLPDGEFGNTVVPVSRDMKPDSLAMSTARVNPANREIRFVRKRKPDWDTYGPTDARSYEFMGTPGSQVQDPHSRWDHDPWFNPSDPENSAILYQIRSSLITLVVECGQFSLTPSSPPIPNPVSGPSSTPGTDTPSTGVPTGTRGGSHNETGICSSPASDCSSPNGEQCNGDHSQTCEHQVGTLCSCKPKCLGGVPYCGPGGVESCPGDAENDLEGVCINNCCDLQPQGTDDPDPPDCNGGCQTNADCPPIVAFVHGIGDDGNPYVLQCISIEQSCVAGCCVPDGGVLSH